MSKDKRKAAMIGFGSSAAFGAANKAIVPVIMGKDKLKLALDVASPESQKKLETLLKAVSKRHGLPNPQGSFRLHDARVRAPNEGGGLVKDYLTNFLNLYEGVNLPNTNKYLALHELGHYKDLYKNPKLKQVLRGAMPVASLTGIGMATSDNKTVRKIAPFVPAVGAIPTLAQEAKATGFALKELKNINPKQLAEARRVMGKAFGTYLAIPAASTVAAILAKRYRDKKDLEKRAGTAWNPTLSFHSKKEMQNFLRSSNLGGKPSWGEVWPAAAGTGMGMLWATSDNKGVRMVSPIPVIMGNALHLLRRGEALKQGRKAGVPIKGGTGAQYIFPITALGATLALRAIKEAKESAKTQKKLNKI